MTRFRPIALLVALLAMLAVPALAKSPAGSTKLVDPAKYGAIIMDYGTGAILWGKNMDKQLHPASMTKMMTLLLLFEALDRGTYTLDSDLPVSAHAAKQPPSKLGVQAGKTIKVDHAIRALAVKSANDVAMVVGEAVGGSEEGFARLATRRARQLGMKNTVFRNPSGLTASGMRSTPRDMALLVRHLIRNHPTRFHYFSTLNFKYGGATMRNSNRLLGVYPGMDGMKTGYTRPAGFNLAATAKRDGHRLIAVVYGGRSGATRNAHMRDLLDWGFEQLEGGRSPRELNAALQASVIRAPARLPRKPVLTGLRTTVAAAATPRPPILTAEEGSTDGDIADNDPIGALAARVGGGTYAVQVGAFRNRESCDIALRDTRGLSAPLSQAPGEVVQIAGLWRARFTGLSRDSAMGVCQDLRRHQRGCLVLSVQ